MKQNWYKIALKKEAMLKIASMSVWVPDAKLPHRMDTMLQVSSELEERLGWKMQETFTKSEWAYFKEHRVMEFVIHDNSTTGYDDDSGIINFYTSGFPRDKIGVARDFLSNELTKMNIDFVAPTQLEQSGAYDSYVLRYKINKIQEDSIDRPPELNLANANSKRIFNGILGFPYIDEYQCSFSINPRELIDRINKVSSSKVDEFTHEGKEGFEEVFGQVPGFNTDEPEELQVNEFLDIQPSEYDQSKEQKGPQIFEDAKTKEYYELRLDRISEIAQWAIDHGFEEILVN